MGTEATGDSATPPSPSDVRAQLERILASADFTASHRLRRFLRYIVEEFLAGRGELIKAYSIALEVLERDDTFDPNADPVVRIEAGRLRRALERYYLVAGRGDPILIEIPKGGYVPHFTWHAAGSEAAAPGPLPPPSEPPPATVRAPADVPPDRRPVRPATLAPGPVWLAAGSAVAIVGIVLAWVWLGRPAELGTTLLSRGSPDLPVVQVRPYNATGPETARSIADGLTEELITRLAEIKELAVTGEEPARPEASAPGLIGPARYRLEGGVRQAEDELRVTSRLVDPATGTVLWSRAEDADLSQTSMLALQSRMAAEIAAAIAQPYGVVMRLERERAGAAAAGSDAPAYLCTLRFYAYREAMSAESHAEVRACLRDAVERYPSFAMAWAMLAWVELDEDRLELNPSADARPALERALGAARRALEIDPDNPRAEQALMLALFLSGEAEEGMRVGERAIAEHPDDMELLSEFGLRVALAGDLARGQALMRQGIAGNPARAGHYRGTLAVMAYLQGDYHGALAELRQSDQQEVGMYYLFAAMSYAQLGMMEEAREAAERFMREQPYLAANIDAELDRRAIRPPARARLIEGMRRAGIPVKGEEVVHHEGALTPVRP